MDKYLQSLQHNDTSHNIEEDNHNAHNESDEDSNSNSMYSDESEKIRKQVEKSKPKLIKKATVFEFNESQVLKVHKVATTKKSSRVNIHVEDTEERSARKLHPLKVSS